MKKIKRSDVDWDWDPNNNEYVVRVYHDGTATKLAEVRYSLEQFQQLAVNMLQNTTYRVRDLTQG